MGINLEAVKNARDWLGPQEAKELVRLAKEQERLESYWRAKLQNFFRNALNLTLKELEANGTFDPNSIDFEAFFMEQSLSSMTEGMKSLRITTGKKDDPALQLAPIASRLSAGKPPPAKVPKGFKELMEMWDEWRENKKPGKRQKVMARKVKQAYIKKVQGAWDKWGEAFRSGEEFTRAEAIKQIRKATEAPYARAKMIVETETTYYYNKVRRDIYDESPDVTHYLFMSIRDHRTTMWCKSRHGVVFKKGSKLLEQNTPPCFAGCSMVLTLDGWKRIDCIGIADYVWTHENRWRQVTEVHCQKSAFGNLLQIGDALATPNHPYRTADFGYIQAEFLGREQGVLSGSPNLSKVCKAAMEAMGVSGPKILLKSLWKLAIGCYSERFRSSMFQGSKDRQEWLRADSCQRASNGFLGWLCKRTPTDNGKALGKILDSGRGCASHQSHQVGQPIGKPSIDDQFGTPQVTPRRAKGEEDFFVYNLEVDEDHTYVAGGYEVHNCHWNCRSEILPLTPLNPRQLALIENPSLKAENRTLYPLPPGWTGR